MDDERYAQVTPRCRVSEEVARHEASMKTLGDEALVYTEDHCGVLCGEGTFVHLKRGDDGWRVEKKLTVWVE
jgi:hypothetical protein